MCIRDSYHSNWAKALSSELNWSLIDHTISKDALESQGYFENGFLPGTGHYFFDAPQEKPDTCAELRAEIEECYIDLLEYIKKTDAPVLLVESPFIVLENDAEGFLPQPYAPPGVRRANRSSGPFPPMDIDLSLIHISFL